MKRLGTLLGSMVMMLSGLLQAQVLEVTPTFPTINDSVTIIYNAAEGNGALVGTTPVHAHTGVITAASNSPSDWQNVQTAWGSSDGEMTDLGDNRHQISYRISTYYGVTAADSVESLAFVFRNAAGTTVGRDTDGSDIFYPVYEEGVFYAEYLNTPRVIVAEPGEQVNLRAASSDAADLFVTVNGGAFNQALNDSLLDISFSNSMPGLYDLELEAIAGMDTLRDTVSVVVRGPVIEQPLPANVEDGINYLNDSTVVLVLFAPEKDYVYLLGDFNGWQPNPEYYMRRTMDGQRYWVQINNLNPGQEYGYQFFIDGTLRIADPYAEKILDPDDDPFIDAVTYPNLKPYPVGQASGNVSVLQTAKPTYQWQNTNYQRPANEELVIYELLVRDFIATHNYQTLIDTLDYLENLGVNAIELMPIMEFEGNSSWGYNPSFFFAVDKYYGTENDLRAFIDSCHGRGMVVLLDMVLNHAFGQCPLVQMYWDSENNQPAANSPWFNQQPTHPFNVGFDFNHEADPTKYFVDRVLAYWVDEYRFDGYRMDLSKGFTQVNNLNDVGAWSAYDPSRIALLKRMYDELLLVDPGVYFTLEHLGDNQEEKELAEYGMMLWSKLTEPYNEATMGYNTGNKSNFSWMHYNTARGWDVPHNITYMESHDEERLMYKNLQFGAIEGAYSTRNVQTALRRMQAAATCFFPIPGPKMLWQFGEVGYDVNIDFNGRTGEKPIRWEYFADSSRRVLYDVYSSLIKLRESAPVFHTADFELQVGSAVKRIYLRGENGDNTEIFILANFDVVAQTVAPGFPSTDRWYDFFSGDSIDVTSTTQEATLAPGEFFLFSNSPLPPAEVTWPLRDIYGTFVSLEAPGLAGMPVLAPNPVQDRLALTYTLQQSGHVRVEVLDMQGRRLALLNDVPQLKGAQAIDWQVPAQLVNGLYFVRVSTETSVETLKWQLAR